MRAAGARRTARDVDAVGAATKRTGAAAKTSTGNFSRFGAALGSTNKRLTGISRGLKGAGSAFSALTFPILGAAAISGKLSIDFEKAMRNVNSIAQLPERAFRRLSESVKDLAGPTAQAPQTLAEGMYDLVSTGFTASQALTVMKAAARGATAGLTTASVSADVLSSVLKAYRLPASDAAKMTDILFRTVDRGKISFEQLATSIGDTLPFATSLKVPLQDVGASIATMTKQGIPVPETMTRIRNLLQTMIKPGENLTKAFKSLGVESGEALIKQKGFQGALEAVVGTTDGSKTAVAQLFPNIRALGGALALTGANAKAAQGDLKGMGGASGSTSRALQQQSKSTAFQWQRMLAQLKVLAIEVAEEFLPALKDIVHWLGGVIKWFKSLNPETRKWIVIIGIAVGVLGPFLIILGAIVAAGAALASTAGLIVVGIAALAAGVVYAYTKFEWFRDAVGLAWDILKHMPAVWLIKQLDNIFNAFKKIPGAIKSGMIAAVNFMIDRINNIISALNVAIDLANKLPGVDIGNVDPVGKIYTGPNPQRQPGPTSFGGMRTGLAGGGVITRSGVFDVGERGRETVYLPAGAAVTPHGGAGVAVVHTHVHLDGKEVAKSVRRHTLKARSTS